MVAFDRITLNPAVMGGKACIRGLRVTVSMIVREIGAGRAVDDLLTDYAYLEREDILQALRYAAWRTEAHPVEDPTLDAGYRAMAADKEREQEARTWVKGTGT